MNMVNTSKDSILIVDDSPTNIHVLVQALGQNYDIRIARDGKTALYILNTSEPPDLILLDVMMPGMNGYEVCRQVKETVFLQDIPVIFITTMDEEESQLRGLELGAVDYITKPFNAAIVKLRVKNHIELKKQRDLLAQMSYTDGLTGIPNRRAFDNAMDREWKRAGRLQTTMAMLLLDIDYFKLYNDNYGHLAGDDCLKKIAKIFASVLTRPGDFLGRYGGEEFACVLPDTDEKGATHVAARIHEQIAEAAIAHAYSPVKPIVTISIGIAVAVVKASISPEAFIDLADTALYKAKNSGRNQTCCLVLD